MHKNINTYTVRIAPKERRALYQDVEVKAHNIHEAREMAQSIYSGFDIIWVR